MQDYFFAARDVNIFQIKKCCGGHSASHNNLLYSE
jgi:hypothetical protein